MTSHPIITFFEEKLMERRDPEKAEKMTAYMKNIQPHLGVHTPIRGQIYKEFKKGLGKQYKGNIDNNDLEVIIYHLWNKPEREYRYVSMFLLDYFDWISIEKLPKLKNFIIEGGWWDTTDSIAIDFISRLLRDNKEEMTSIIKKWVEDENLWVRRTAILSQLYFKSITDEKLLEYCITKTMFENEFFIQKAIGWALREYSKTNPKFVSNFINKYENSLSKLSIREGRKHLAKLERSKS